MSAENLFTTSRIENVNQIIAELYDDSILLEKRMESFFLNLNNIVFFEKANFLFYQKQGQNYKTHSIYTINWNDEQKRRYQEEYCHMDDVLDSGLRQQCNFPDQPAVQSGGSKKFSLFSGISTSHGVA